MKLKYIVTGTGRSGTVYMARLLTSVGVLCGHETIFDYAGIDAARRRLTGELSLNLSVCSTVKFDPLTKTHENISWHPDVNNIVADSSYMAAPFLEDDIVSDAEIIHVVRDPIKVINSFCNSLNYFSDVNSSDSYERFIYGVFPELKSHMPQYDRAALYYLLWNKMIEQSAVKFFFRVEDDSVDVLKFLKLDKNMQHYNDTQTNVFEKIKEDTLCSYKQIKSMEIRTELIKMSYKYGYLCFI